MKKSAIALAVAAALAASAASQAETTLYGSARVSVDYVDPDDIKVVGIDENGNLFKDKIGADDAQWDVFNNSSRLGVRGSEDLGGGLSAIYQYEFGVDMTEGGNFNSNRPKLIGLKGGFGQISVGTQWSPYYNVLGIFDVFNSSRTFDNNYLGTFRRDNSVIYKTPNWSGFSLEGMLRMNEDERRDSIDEWQLNAKYENGPFFIGGAMIQDKGGCPKGDGTGAITGDQCRAEPPEVPGDPNFPQQNTLYGAAAGWSGTNWGLSAIYEYLDFDKKLVLANGDEVSDRQNISGLLEYTFGNNIIRGSYSYIDNDDPDSTSEWVIGFQHNLSKRSRLWVEYIGTKDRIRQVDEFVAGESDQAAFSIGMRHDF
jgi:predicted porin